MVNDACRPQLLEMYRGGYLDAVMKLALMLGTSIDSGKVDELPGDNIA